MAHTLILKAEIPDTVYLDIRKNYPTYFFKKDETEYFSSTHIDTEHLQTLSEEEKKHFPDVTINRAKVVRNKNANPNEQKYFYYHYVEIFVNYNELIVGKDCTDTNNKSFAIKSTPANNMLSMVFHQLLMNVLQVIPELKCTNKSYISFFENLRYIFYKEQQEHIPDNTLLFQKAVLNPIGEINTYLHEYFTDDDIQVFANPIISKKAKEQLFNQILSPMYDFFSDRIDYALDIKSPYKDIYLILLAKCKQYSKKRANSKHIPKHEIYSNVDENGIVHIESYSFKNKSLGINIYDKSKEMSDKNKEVPEDIKDLFRIEIQELKNKLKYMVDANTDDYKKINNRNIIELLRGDVEEQEIKKILSKIIYTGDFHTLSSAYEIIDNSKFKHDKKEKLKKVLYHVAKKHSLQSFIEAVDTGKITDCGKPATVKAHLNSLNELRINPITLSRELEKRMKSIPTDISINKGKYIHGKDFLLNPMFYLDIEREKQKCMNEII